VSCVAYGYTPNRLPRPLEFLGVLNVVSETPIGPFADLKEGTSNGGFVHTSDIDQPELLRFASTAAFGKLHCGEAIPCERLLWAVISDVVLSVSRKQTLAAAQKIGKVGP